MSDFINPYTKRVQALTQTLAQLQGQPIQPAYSPEVAGQRRTENTDRELLGILGEMSGDPTFSNVGGTVLKSALADRAKRITDRGEYDPITGVFRMHPEARRLQQETFTERQLDQAQNAELRAEERWQADRQRAEDQRALRQTIAATTGANAGSWSLTGVDPSTGSPVFTHNKTLGMAVMTPEGPKPYAGGGVQQREAYERSQKAKGESQASLDRAEALLGVAAQNESAFSTIRGNMEKYTPEAVRGVASNILFDKEEQRVRGIVLMQAAQSMHELIGAAQTDTERRGLIPFLVQPGDPPEVALNKLQSAVDVAKMHRSAMNRPKEGWGRGGGASGSFSPSAPDPRGVEVAPGVFVRQK